MGHDDSAKAPLKIPYKITTYILSNHKLYIKAIDNDSANPLTPITLFGWFCQSSSKNSIKNYYLIYINSNYYLIKYLE